MVSSRVEIPWHHADADDVILSGWVCSSGDVEAMALVDGRGVLRDIPLGYEDQAETELLEAAQKLWAR